mgnify:FL=1
MSQNTKTLLESLMSDMPKARQQEIRTIVHKLNIPEDDYYLFGIVVLDLYRDYYEEIPHKIQQASEQALKDHLARIKIDIDWYQNKIQSEIANAVHLRADVMANETANKQTLRQVAITALTLSCILLIGGYEIFKKGKETGIISGYAQAQDEKSAAYWTTTDEGKKVWNFWNHGPLQILMSCSGNGWEIKETEKGTFCYPIADENNKIYGWKL